MLTALKQCTINTSWLAAMTPGRGRHTTGSISPTMARWATTADSSKWSTSHEMTWPRPTPPNL